MAKLWGWFTNNPIAQIITAAVLALIGWEVVKRNIQETGRIKERERIAAAQAKVREATEQRQHEIIDEEQTHADQAIQARDSGQHYPTYDELPDPHKRILSGRRTGEAGS
jgi:hypothetical protein